MSEFVDHWHRALAGAPMTAPTLIVAASLDQTLRDILEDLVPPTKRPNALGPNISQNRLFRWLKTNTDNIYDLETPKGSYHLYALRQAGDIFYLEDVATSS